MALIGLRPSSRSRASIQPLSLTLSPEQQRSAILPDMKVGESVAAAFHDNLVLPREGLPANAMTAAQRDMLREVIQVYVDRIRPGHAQIRMGEIDQHLDETTFGWQGEYDGQDAVFYYRVHSPVVLIEFDHQRGVALDNDEPSRKHIHTVVRTPNGNDYGKDLLRLHHQTHPHHRRL